jgi:hypothetical protein
VTEETNTFGGSDGPRVRPHIFILVFISLIIKHSSSGGLVKPICGLPYNLMTSASATLLCYF